MSSSFKKFSGPLDYRYDYDASQLLGEDHWRVLRGFRYYIGELRSNEWVDIEWGELSDRASVPRILWSIVPPDGAHGQAAVLHDKLCRTLTIIKDGEPVRITRAKADALFLEAMEALNTPWLRRRLAYMAVSAYRVVSFTSEPQENPLRARLEREWRGQ
jgi:hypothetical protein